MSALRFTSAFVICLLCLLLASVLTVIGLAVVRVQGVLAVVADAAMKWGRRK
jgi:hypothetical protein